MIKPTELLERMRGQNGKRQAVGMSTLFRECGVNPANEEDRKAVWNIAQTAATLVREGYVYLNTQSGERVYFTK